jgi:hypothetical protein
MREVVKKDQGARFEQKKCKQAALRKMRAAPRALRSRAARQKNG